jgi:hypothetical protein
MTQEALKMALDALETELSIDWGNQDEFNASAEKMYKAIAAIKEALAQEQEPVGALTLGGIIDTSDGLEYEGWDVEWDSKVIEALQEKLVTSDSVEVMLYIHPPQRTWQGLTDEQIDACWNKTLWKEKQPHHIFAKAIEAKLKDKNCAG